MPKLMKCKSCGNMIAKSASFCPQCGGKVKRTSGCAILFLIFIAIAFFSVLISGGNGSSSSSESAQQNNDNSPENADPFQVEYFSNDGAMICAQNHLESKISANIKYTTAAKVEKLSASGKDKVPGGVNPDNLWIVYQDFTERNAFGVDLKHSYIATVEFAKGKGYRVVTLLIDDTIIP